jgi:hypothetical protein
LHACWFVAPFDSGDISRAVGCVHLLDIKPSRAPKSSCACSQMTVCVELCNTIGVAYATEISHFCTCSGLHVGLSHPTNLAS